MKRIVRATCPLLLALCLLLVSLAGCTRSPQYVYSLADETSKLPELHQSQIQERLTQYFGTPANPRLRVPSADESDGGEPVLVDAIDATRLEQGAAVFNRRCAGCHGMTGDGRGEAAAYLQPKPRDYRNGIFKFTSTPYGAKPNRADLIHLVRLGAKGTSMPSFKFLPDDELQVVIDYVIMLSHRGELERTVAQIAQVDYDADMPLESFEFVETIQRIHDAWQQAEYQGVLPITAQPRMTDETIIAGRKAFLRGVPGCYKCHGEDFRGQTKWLSHEFIAAQQAKPEGERESINYDAWGDPAPAADLTAGMLHGGRRPIDIYRRIYTGINGTPMPAFGQSLAAEPDTIWHLVHYVLSVVEDREVEGLDKITVQSVADEAAASESEK